jgi:hypothetical protein
MKPSDFYYCVERNSDYDDSVSFCFTSIEYWNENECLDDCLSRIDCLPKGFHNAMEAIWEFNGSVENGELALKAAGFQWSQEMDAYINKTQD